MIAATRLGSMSALNSCCTAFLTSARSAQWQGKGTWYSSGGNGPNCALYGCTLPVSATANRLRPWKAPLNAMTPARRVWARAILIAFSTASAPVLNSAVFFAWVPGVSAFSFSASAM